MEAYSTAPFETVEKTSDSSSPNWFAGHVLNPLLNGIAITPYNAVANAVNFATPGNLLGKADSLPISQTEFLTPGWFVQNVSAGLGAIGPYVVAGKFAGFGMKGAAAKFALNGPRAGFLTSEVAAQASGAAMLDFARDTHEGETRWGNAIGGGISMYVFGKGNALTGVADNLLQRGATRFAIGAAGGMAGFTGSRLASGEGVTGEELIKAGVTGGTMNVALPPTQHLVKKGFERAGTATHDAWMSKPVQDIWKSRPVESAYWRTRGNLREGYTSARQASHQFLAEHNLSHPYQRFMDAYFPREVPVIRPPLTPENNPAVAFEKALPEYFNRVKEGEVAIEVNATGNRYDVYRQNQEMRSDFAAQLLTIWHGSASAPGIKHYSDAELATPGISAERVGQIREAFMQTSKGERHTDPFTEAIVKLAPKGITDDLPNESYAIDGLERAREKFYGYDSNVFGKNMSLPRMHAYRDTDNHITPHDWMPYEPTPLLANLFHGSMSKSLESVFRERGILSSHELRLRGINQSTGESAGQEFPRRSVSITRDFNEAYAYHRHSPEFLTEFPVVYGISRDVAPRLDRAGFLEPGELLIPSMGLGHNFLTRMGLRNPDITHLYVPDGEVQNVTNQLWASRINGVRVVGFNEIPKPDWHPEPTVQEMLDMGYR